MRCPNCKRVNAVQMFSSIECENSDCIHFFDKNKIRKVIFSDGEKEYQSEISRLYFHSGPLTEEENEECAEWYANTSCLVSLGPIIQHMTICFETSDEKLIKLDDTKHEMQH
jgi:hypothetical protein